MPQATDPIYQKRHFWHVWGRPGIRDSDPNNPNIVKDNPLTWQLEIRTKPFADELELIPLVEICPVDLESEFRIRLTLILWVFTLINAVPFLIVFIHQTSDLSLFPDVRYIFIYFGIAALVSVALLLFMRDKFKAMDENWSISVERLFQEPVKNRMRAIRLSIFSLRQHTDWRRFADSVEYFILFMAIYIAAAVISMRVGFLDLSILELMAFFFSIVLGIGFADILTRFVEHQSVFRDPSLQISVMLNEIDRERYFAKTASSHATECPELGEIES